jgi:hypothetical protein
MMMAYRTSLRLRAASQVICCIYIRISIRERIRLREPGCIPFAANLTPNERNFIYFH